MQLIISVKNKILHLWQWFLHTSLLKKGLTIIVLLLVIWFVYSRLGQKNAKVQYQTATVTKGTLISTLTESGNISTDNQTNVTSPTDGIITAVYVKNGDTVTAGENLFSVKSTATPQEKEQAYADYLSAQNAVTSANQSKQSLQASLEEARAAVISASSDQTTMQNNLNTSQNNPSTKMPYTQNDIDLINSKLTSARESFTATETKYNQADTAIAQANASFQVANLKYQATQDSTVTAPTSGKIANLSATTGTAVTAATTTTTTTGSGSNSSSSSSTSGGSTVLVIGNFANLYIKAPISEVDVASVKAGQNATITLDAFPDATYVGKVDSVDTIGTNSSGVVTYDAYIRLIDPPANIRPAMTASVVIQTNRKDDVLSVPTSAIQTVNETSYVRELKNGQVVQVPVETGIASDTNTEITSGVSEGDTVITSIITPQTTTTSQTASPFSGTRGVGSFGGGNAVFRSGGGGGATRTGGRGGGG
ncbi:MAG TPA: efflux RND transporter periplasmic adaptor subunit [Patescibacteria group bacterium]|nr:efflux RND transporter periplasmic adaptor subunit [Patescibacteria group bacterium]